MGLNPRIKNQIHCLIGNIDTEIQQIKDLLRQDEQALDNLLETDARKVFGDVKNQKSIALYALSSNGYVTVGQISNLSIQQMLACKGFGKKSLVYVLAELARFGLKPRFS